MEKKTLGNNNTIVNNTKYRKITTSTKIWKVIDEFPDYKICPKGIVKNIKTSRLLYPTTNRKGYPCVSLNKDGKNYTRTIHILLGRAFIYNPDPVNKNQINHIDGNKENYNLKNLEWVTQKENNIHAIRTGLRPTCGDKTVIQYSLNGDYIAEYKSVSEASRKTGIDRSQIGKVCNHYVSKNGEHKITAGGFKWEWKNDKIKKSS